MSKKNQLRILSRRAFETWPSWDLIFEYEDQIAAQLDIPIVTPGKFAMKMMRLRDRILNILGVRPKKRNLIFFMIASPDFKTEYHDCGVAVIVDYFLPQKDLNSFLKATEKIPLVLVTSRQAYDSLLENGADPKRFRHWPLSLPDRYKYDPRCESDKEYDVALIGRTSPVLEEYLKRYSERHPMSVLERKVESRHFNFYDPDGNLVGNTDTREDYMDLLRKTKVIMYSTPGIDGDKSTNGFSQVTPRFLEALAMGCNIVMKYQDNADTSFFGLKEFGRSVETYEDFETAMDNALAMRPDNSKRESYLRQHYTSHRCKELDRILMN